MNKIKQLSKESVMDILLIFILSLLAYKAWYLLPQLTIRSDGFIYLLSKSHQWFFNTPFFFTGFENSAMVFGFLFSKFYGVHLQLYYWTELFVMLIINALWYLTIKKISHNRLVAFSAALMFAVNYFGVWDMVSDHCYCFFLERVIPVLFLIPSILFLQDFLEKKSRKSFVISLLFYFFGLGIGHFVVLFTPFYFLYPIFWFIFEKRNKNIKDRAKGIFFGLAYLSISGLLIVLQQINESGLGPHKWTFFQFLLHPGQYLYFKKIALQLVYWSQTPVIGGRYLIDSIRKVVEIGEAESLIFFAIFVYIFAGVIIYKLLPKQRALLLTIILATITMFYLNAYFNQYDILGSAEPSRYLYFPSFLLTLFWTLFIWAVFWQRSNVLRLFGIILLGMFYFTNVWLVDGNFHPILRSNWSTRAVFEYIIANRARLPKNTLIVAPYPQFGSQESTFFTDQLGNGEVRYMSIHNPDDVDTWEKQASISANVIKLRYKASCDCIEEVRIK